jgi:hypothetical protein
MVKGSTLALNAVAHQALTSSRSGNAGTKNELRIGFRYELVTSSSTRALRVARRRSGRGPGTRDTSHPHLPSPPAKESYRGNADRFHASVRRVP